MGEGPKSAKTSWGPRTVHFYSTTSADLLIYFIFREILWEGFTGWGAIGMMKKNEKEKGAETTFLAPSPTF